MVKITHKAKLPTQRFTERWFENSFPFSRTLHPWFKIDPVEEMERAWGDYLDYMEQFFTNNRSTSLQKFPMSITCDLADRGDRFILTADLPGMEKDEVAINILNNEIEISAEHKESKEEKEKEFIRKERSHVRYYRSLTLPDEIVRSKITAKMNNGILTVELPKKTPTKVEEPVQIKVQ
jgi:HSP20 family protein